MYGSNVTKSHKEYVSIIFDNPTSICEQKSLFVFANYHIIQ
jgi:hypothetical protein